MKFKEEHLSDELAEAHYLLREILHDLDDLAPSEITITSVARDATTRVISASSPPPGTSPHEARPCRAADVRTSDMVPGAPEHLCHEINMEWVYDPSRPNKVVALMESDHIHVQVHANTRRRHSLLGTMA